MQTASRSAGRCRPGRGDAREGRGRRRRRLRALPGVLRRGRARASPTAPWSATSSPRPSTQDALLGRPGRRRRRRTAVQHRQLRRRRHELHAGPAAAARRGHRHPGRLRHRRHRQRAAEDVHKRRGIAGDFVVFKVAGAAAEAGYDLDGVERVARHANDRTRTLGVAFAGCTMPGADRAAVHRARRADGRRARHPRRAGHRRGRAAPRGRPGAAPGRRRAGRGARRRSGAGSA